MARREEEERRVPFFFPSLPLCNLSIRSSFSLFPYPFHPFPITLNTYTHLEWQEEENGDGDVAGAQEEIQLKHLMPLLTPSSLHQKESQPPFHPCYSSRLRLSSYPEYKQRLQIPISHPSPNRISITDNLLGRPLPVDQVRRPSHSQPLASLWTCLDGERTDAHYSAESDRLATKRCHAVLLGHWTHRVIPVIRSALSLDQS